jgi:large subunit ribosomal protein L25
MANIIELQAQARSESGTAAVGRLRRAGTIPGVLYGRNRDNSKIQVDGKTFTRIIDHSASDNILVNLQIGGDVQLALVQEVQHDHLKGGILHVDFHAVAADEDIHASVPVETVGTPAGAKFGGQLELMLHAIEVHCLPKDLPEKISIDVSALNVGESIHIRELQLPAGVNVRLDGDVVVVIIHEPKVDDSPAAAAAPAAKGAAPAKAAAPAAGKK